MNRALQKLGSLPLALAGMAALGAGILASYAQPNASPLWTVAPLALLSANLLAALAGNPRLRAQGGLLVFHLCLLAVFLIAAAGRLSALDARLELAEGEAFDARNLEALAAGPLHPWAGLRAVAFEQARIRVEYARGLARGRTRSELWLSDRSGQRRRVTIGDTLPLRVAGYRFYTTSNKGFAVVLSWLGDDGSSARGVLNLPSYPLHDWKLVNTWTTPAGSAVGVDLRPTHHPPQNRAWALDSAHLASPGRLRVSAGGETVSLEPGDAVSLPGGRLRYEGLRLWMGYRVHYDPTLPYLFAAGLVGVIGIAAHFRRKLWPAARSETRPGSEHAAVFHRT